MKPQDDPWSRFPDADEQQIGPHTGRAQPTPTPQASGGDRFAAYPDAPAPDAMDASTQVMMPDGGLGGVQISNNVKTVDNPWAVKHGEELGHMIVQGATLEQLNQFITQTGGNPSDFDLTGALAERQKPAFQEWRRRFPDAPYPVSTKQQVGLTEEEAGASANSASPLGAAFAAAADGVSGGGLHALMRDEDRQKMDLMTAAHPAAAVSGELAGGGIAVSGLEAGGAWLGAKLPGVFGRIIASPITAAAEYGGASSAASGQNPIEGALFGAAGGAAGRALGRVVGTRSGLLPRPEPIPRGSRLAFDALSHDNVGPNTAIDRLREAGTMGVPLIPADLGDNARGMLGSLSRQPGPTRSAIREAVVNRQMGQADRLQSGIRNDLGPTANVAQQSEDLMRTAQTDAKPLYEAAYAAPNASSLQINDLLQRPSMASGLARARRIAIEEGRDPNTLGIDIGPQGDPVLGKVPSWQTADYIKRGLDDVLERYRDPVTNRLRLDEEGRAIQATRREFIKRVDAANPNYAAARAAYGGPMKERDAFQLGTQALRMSADEAAMVAERLTPSQRRQFSLGYRSALSNSLDARIDGADKVSALVGTPKKRQILSTILGESEGFNQFGRRVDLERAANDTYRAVATGSPTAGRMADDAMMQLAEHGTHAAASAIRSGGIMGGLGSIAVSSLHDLLKYGVGKAGAQVRQDAASFLTDPELAIELLRKIGTNSARKRFNKSPVFNGAGNTVSGSLGASSATAPLRGN